METQNDGSTGEVVIRPGPPASSGGQGFFSMAVVADSVAGLAARAASDAGKGSGPGHKPLPRPKPNSKRKPQLQPALKLRHSSLPRPLPEGN
ncbi:hypothetical protein D9M71_120530 [compost metagenome]